MHTTLHSISIYKPRLQQLTVFHACAGKRKLLHKEGVCFDHRNMAAAPVTMPGRLKGKDGERQSSLFEACKNGDLEKVKKFLTPENVNSRDTAGRKSTPLHFAAGITCHKLFVAYVVVCLECLLRKMRFCLTIRLSGHVLAPARGFT